MSAAAITERDTRQLWWLRFGEALTSRRLWLLIAVFEVALAMVSTMPGDLRRPLLNLAGGVVASSALLAVVWLGRLAVLRHLSGMALVIGAVPLIILGGVARGTVLQALYVHWDMSSPGWDGFRFRIFNSVAVVLTAAVVGTLVRVTVDTHRRRLEELIAAQRRLTLVLSRAEGTLRAEQSDAVATITATLAEQLRHSRGSSTDEAMRSLEQLADDVVRPLSHELAAAAPRWQPPSADTLRQHLDWASVWGAVASPGHLHPLGPALIVLLFTPSSAFHMGVVPALWAHVVVAVLIFLGLVVLRRTGAAMGADCSTPVRLAATSAATVVACLPAAIAAWFLSDAVGRVANTVYVLVGTPIVALMFTFIGAARAQQRTTEQAIEAVLAQTSWWVRRTHMVQWWQNGTLARALHGPVQSAIHVAAQRLRSAAETGVVKQDMVGVAFDDVSRTLTEAVMPRPGSADFAAELADLAATWRPLATITIEPAAVDAPAIAADPVCCEIAVDVITEAVSNAVRHGGARHLQIAVIAVAEGELSFEVVDDGRGWVASDDTARTCGLGTAQLDTCALWWQVTTASGANHLVVGLPWLPMPMALPNPSR